MRSMNTFHADEALDLYEERDRKPLQCPSITESPESSAF